MHRGLHKLRKTCMLDYCKVLERYACVTVGIWGGVGGGSILLVLRIILGLFSWYPARQASVASWWQ